MRILTILAATAILVSPAAAKPGGKAAADRAAIQALIDATYEVISGPVGQERDFDRMRAQFLPGAVMGVAGPGKDGRGRAVTMDVEGYIERAGPNLVKTGFTEKATRTEIEIYGELAYVKSAYEGFSAESGEKIAVGVNFFTLLKTEGEWKVAAILWREADKDWPVERAFE